MTVSSTSSRVVYAGNGSTTVFPFAFKVALASELAVVFTDASGVDLELSPSQYGATGFGQDAGGSVTYPLSGDPIANGTRLTIYRDVPLTQPTQISNQGAMWPQVIEAALDRQAWQGQKLQDQLDRALLADISEQGSLDPLPTADQRAGKFLMFDNDGQPATTSGAPGDASTTGFLPAGTGAVPRDVQSRLRERVSVLDFIPTALHAEIVAGTSTTNVHTYLQAAIDHLESAGGGTLHFPFGVYLIGATLTINKGVKLVGEGEIGDTPGASLAPDGTVIQWNSLASADLIAVKSTTANHYLYGFGIRNIMLRGSAAATAGIRASSIANCDFHLSAFDFTEAGVVVDDSNGVISFNNNFRMRFIYGVAAATDGAHGLKFDGDVIGVTQNTIHWLSGLVKNGWMLWLSGADGNHVFTIQAAVNSGGTGGAVRFNNGPSYPAQNNQIEVMWGRAHAESATFGNEIKRAHSEAGGVTIDSGGQLHYTAYDYLNAERWDCHSFVMSDEYLVPTGSIQTDVQFTTFLAAYNPASMADGEGVEVDVTVASAILGDLAHATFSLDTQGIILNAQVTATNTVTVRFQNETGGTVDLGSGTIQVVVRARPTRTALKTEYAALWGSISFPNAATTAAWANIMPPRHWSDGRIVGLKLHHGTDVGNSSAAVRLHVQAITKANNASVATPQEDENFTVLVNDSASRYRVSSVTFGVPLPFTRGDFLGLRIERVGADGADTASGNWHLLGVSVLYESDGPDSPGSGTWSIPPVGIQ